MTKKIIEGMPEGFYFTEDEGKVCIVYSQKVWKPIFDRNGKFSCYEKVKNG